MLMSSAHWLAIWQAKVMKISILLRASDVCLRFHDIEAYQSYFLLLVRYFVLLIGHARRQEMTLKVSLSDFS